jgi:outer membrane protein OmpA-like peptidoglycan-associated protein
MGRRRTSARKGRDEGEKPFWISYADLMTALMVLFLVVMAVAVLAIGGAEGRHRRQIDACLDKARAVALEHGQGVVIDKERRVIDFGSQVLFAFNSAALTPLQESVLRTFVPRLLEVARAEVCSPVFKRVVVDGYTDKTGMYLANLHLSLMRSESVLCALFRQGDTAPLSPSQMADVRDMFMVGGFAFNASKDTAAASRRVEMRIEFWGVREKPETQPAAATLPDAAASSPGFGKC